MSDDDAKFAIYLGGKFVISENNITTYDGGEIITLLSHPEKLLTTLQEVLGISLYGQRIWYKLPFEDFTELKMLFNGDAMHQKMVQATMWTKAAEIFLQKDGDDDDVSDNAAGATCNADEATGNGEDVVGEMLEEEARVEENLKGFMNEAEHDDDGEDTPQN